MSTQEDETPSTTLFVRSIPFSVTAEKLSDFFSQIVPVKHCHIADDKGQSRGYGFVSFTTQEDAAKALLESRKIKIEERLLKVDFARKRERKSTAPSERAIGNFNNNKISDEEVEKRRPRLIIRNLPWSVRDPNQLKKQFTKFGPVVDAYIPRGKNGIMKGFAFVTMRKQDDAQKAVSESKGLKIDGREVAVDFAIEKNKWLQIQTEEVPVSKDDAELSEDEDEGEDDNDDNDDDDDEDMTDSKSEYESDDATDEKEQSKPKKYNKTERKPREEYSIFIRNIPYDATDEALFEHFEEHFGPCRYALSVKGQDGIPKGTAFVSFKNKDTFENCISNAPTTNSTSLLMADDVPIGYVFEGRILSVSRAVNRETANKLSEISSEKRKDILGKSPDEKDKRNLYLLNEGRITNNSKLASLLTNEELNHREESHKLRIQQLKNNPALYISLTRLAIRNLPRALSEKALKALSRKAIVEFAKEVVEKKRQKLSKEEVIRSVKHKDEVNGFKPDDNKKKRKNMGVVKQAKVVLEKKESGELGRSRGFGFVEFRDHKAALMGLRWLNCHEVTPEEIKVELTEEEIKQLPPIEAAKRRRLIVEFAIENSQVVKTQREKAFIAKSKGQDLKRKRSEQDDGTDSKQPQKQNPGRGKHQKDRKKLKKQKGNMNKGKPTNVEKK